MQTARFIKKQEDFICEHCSNRVVGNGYTNHCNKCLWSKHVDINPGDRQSTCGGLMKPIAIEGGTNHYVILHRCEICGYEKRNKAIEGDSIDAILEVIAKRIEQQSPR